MKIDKEFQRRIPKLKPAELAALEASIAAEGCRDPLVVWSRDGKDDVMVDGHNRKAICDRLGIPYRTTPMSFENRQAVIDWMLRHQLGRRNLSKEAAADLIGQVYNQRKNPNGRPAKLPQNEEVSGATCQAVADELGVSRATVERAGAYAAAIDRLTSLLGLMRDELRDGEFVHDGQAEQGRKLRMGDVVELAKQTDTDIEAVWKKITDRGDSCSSVKAAVRELRNEKAARKVKTAKDELVEVRLGDFVEIAKDIPDGSVDVIITDPPYPHEFIACWSQLSEVASRILKPHGLCIAYSGKLHLDECMARLGEHLSFYWQIVFMQTVMPTIHPRKVNTKYKPILVFQNVPEGAKVRAHDRYFIDVIEGEKVEKDSHEWQQSADGVQRLIDVFSNVGDLIFEPFSGGGTTALVARHMNRRCIACEIDKKAYEGSVARVFGVTEAADGR